MLQGWMCAALVVRHGAVAYAAPSQPDPAPMIVSREKDRYYIKLVSAACTSVGLALGESFDLCKIWW
jgi:hypothetical protein